MGWMSWRFLPPDACGGLDALRKHLSLVQPALKVLFSETKGKATGMSNGFGGHLAEDLVYSITFCVRAFGFSLAVLDADEKPNLTPRPISGMIKIEIVSAE